MMQYLIIKRFLRAFRLTLFVLLFLPPTVLFAQPDSWYIRYYSTENGLSSNHVNSIARDSKGIIWVGTDNGLNWFDGYRFSQLKYASGQDHPLSRIKVLSIYRDDGNMLWIGTSDGLFRFDPSESVDNIRQYRYLEPDSLTAIPQPQPVNRICKDRNGVLWVNTGDPDDGIKPELLTFNINSEKFTQKSIERVYGEVRANDGNVEDILDVYADRTGTIWIATNNGIYKYIQQEDSFRHYLPFPGIDFSISNVHLLLYEDSQGNFWTSGIYGLYLFDREHEKFGNPIVLHKQVGLYTEQSVVYCINEDQDGYLWMRVNEVLMRILPDPFNKSSLKIIKQWMPDARNFTSLNERKAMLVENPRSIWISVANKGLCHISLHRNQFRVIEPATLPLRYSEKVNYVTALYSDTIDNLWFSTTLSGPVKYNTLSGETETSKLTPFNMVQEIDMDPMGNLWFASQYGMHHRLGPGNHDLEKLITYHPDKGRVNSLTERKEYEAYGKGTVSDYLYEHLIQKDAMGRIWFNSGKGIHDRYLPETDDFIHLEHREVDYYNNDTCMAEKEGAIWFPTMRGLERIIPPFTEVGAYTFVPEYTVLYKEIEGDTGSLNSNWIKSIYFSRYYEPGTMWLATIGGGLNKMVKIKPGGGDAPVISFEHFTESDGLCNNNVLGILEDRSGNLWLSTLNGLSKFDPRTRKFVNFYKEDGLPSNQFSWARPTMNTDGDMFFPHPDGVIVFDPDSIHSNDMIPKICITHFQINNKEVRPGPNSPIKQDIRYVKALDLKYNQNFLSFEFAALNFEVPERNQYRYKLEGMDRNWIHAGTRRFADYTGLKPGTYTFRVTGSNNNGVWNEKGQALQITIHPPPWYSWWAIMLYALILTILILWFRILFLKRSRTIRALEIEHIEKEKAVELERMKSRFFINVSHEFRTPLSLIKGPVDHALRSAKGSIRLDREEAEMIERNTARLQELIDQLLDISKLESGTEHLRVAHGNLEDYIRSVYSNFISLAESRHIHYRLEISGELNSAWFDSDKVEKILVNLIHNAFKFTRDGGSVVVAVRSLNERNVKHASHVEIIVKDTGAGIPPERIHKVFDRFYQVDGSDTREHGGIGIGLSLVKEMVDLYRGEIDVESRPEAGTTFRIKLPVARGQFREGEQVNRSEEEQKPASRQMRTSTDQPPDTAAVQFRIHGSGEEVPLIVIIEDNDDLRRYIITMLNETYRILSAKNGKQGLELVMQHLPDLVISDVMMPEMDGYTVCRQIKEAEQTSHIPVILLTAKADPGSKIEGLDTGADDYIGKPFDLSELKARIRNLIDQRKRLRENFRRQFISHPVSQLPLTSNDILLQKILTITERHIPDAEFTMDSMAGELNISRSQLFRKVSAVTGYTPNYLLRIMRMKKAAMLFDNGENNVSQVMYQVGYNNPSYFSRSFREMYGMNPSLYTRRER